MSWCKDVRVSLLLALLLMCLTANRSPALGQQRTSPAPEALLQAAQAEQSDLNVQLNLIVASNDAAARGNLPQQLEALGRRLRAALPFTSYRVTTTLLGRVKNGGGLSIKGVASALFPVQASPSSPVFYEWRLAKVRVGVQEAAQIEDFSFSVRMPLVIGTTVAAEAGKPVNNLIQYESTGIFTDVSLREGEPTVIGTVNVGRADELFILVAQVQRATGP